MDKILTAREKMLAGEVFASPDPELGALMNEAQRRLAVFNAVPPGDIPRFIAAAQALFGHFGELSLIKAPVQLEYGTHIEIGDRTFINFGCTFLDCSMITIGDYVAIGPNCQFLTVTHPVLPEERIEQRPDDTNFPYRAISYAKPIVIGDECWLGAGVIVMPGVTIGRGSVVGAGSVVTKDIPPGVIAAGNPCRVMRGIRD